MLGKAIVNFTDLVENRHYTIDDIYHTNDEKRYGALSSDDNNNGAPVIKALTLSELKSIAQKYQINVPAKTKRDDLEKLIEGEIYADVE